ncbi:glycosyltransferase family 2 protein [Alistipes sp. i18-0019-D1]|jgi:glycosyltransferase, family 2|uniref:glycosyltransferase family 2 protein n=1 Tax=Alistipes sp. i18-0019-D1 TaxID=3132707 RepID=UPI0036F1A087
MEKHINNRSMEDSHPLLLTVCCTSYNQVDYIRQCLEGIVMQRTSFRFEAVIHDDASTDGTQDIIREYAEKYPAIIKPILQQENQFSKHDGSLRRILITACKGKYTANLEGDDYWTDPLKLQKQVDFLESHPDYGMVRTNFSRYYQNENRLEPGMFESMLNMTDTHQDYILNARFAGPCTWVYRTEFDRNRPIFDTSRYFGGDLALVLEISRLSKIKYLGDNTAVYRILGKSVSHMVSAEKTLLFLIRLKNTRLLYAKLQPLGFRMKFWATVCRSYRNKYKSAHRYKDWFKACATDFYELLFARNEYFG